MKPLQTLVILAISGGLLASEADDLDAKLITTSRLKSHVNGKLLVRETADFKSGAEKVAALPTGPQRLTLYHAHDHYYLTEEHKEQLNDFVKGLDSISEVSIEGHTDNSGSSAYNYSLAYKRTQEVKQYLEQNFSSDHLQLSQLVFGDSKPRFGLEERSVNGKNRRVELIVESK